MFQWLGHSQTGTTSRFYWTDDAAALDVQIPMLNGDGGKPTHVGQSSSTSTDIQMAEKLMEATNEIVRLRECLDLAMGQQTVQITPRVTEQHPVAGSEASEVIPWWEVQ